MSEGTNSGGTRRHFLAAGAVGIVGAAATSAAGQDSPPVQTSPVESAPKPKPVLLESQHGPNEVQTGPPFAPLPPSKRLGFAVVGLGELSLAEILPAFAQCRFARLAALVSGEPGKAAHVADQYGVTSDHVYDYKGFDRIAQDPTVDVVYIVLPNNMHLEFTERSAKAGKHVLCEKPMANSSREAAAMIAACESAQKQLMIAYRCQYEPYNHEAIRLSRSGQFGAIRLIEATNGQNQAVNRQWRHRKALAGGGSLPDVGIYCLNATRYITGLEPIQVTAQIMTDESDLRFTEVEDRVNFQLKFPTDILASCQTFYSGHESRRLRVTYERGWLDMDPAFSYHGLKMRINEARGMANVTHDVAFPAKSHFALEMDHLAECIQQGRRTHTPGEEGLQDMRIIEAIYQAAREGKPVDLPPVAGFDSFRGLAPYRFS